MPQRYLITGGAGFVGSHLALRLKADEPDSEVLAFDNLHRSGSAMNLPRLEAAGIRFINGDVRRAEDLDAVGAVDVLVECSAEPSVHAGYGESPQYLLDTNLVGALNCLEFLRKTGGDMVFISTSRVYPIPALRELPLVEEGDRLEIPVGEAGPGWSRNGISDSFTLIGQRSLYGATKLSAELLINEYVGIYGMRAIICRCGVLAGPWQMGRVDQGFVALWVARHIFGGNLSYMGFGGNGLQVRDILHPADLYDLLRLQMADMDTYSGTTFNVGGGRQGSLSLRELTNLCNQITGKYIHIGSNPQTRDADIAYYVTDNHKISEMSGWAPQRTVEDIVEEVARWIFDHETELREVFSP